MNALIPQPAEIVEKRREAEGIYTVRVRLAAEEARRAYRFLPGQFNMLYAFGAGDVPMSIVSDPEDGDVIGHTLRAVGPVTNALAALKEGDVLGMRGPFGSCWPLDEAKGKDILIVTGGLGCAPTLGALHYLFRRREDYGAIKIVHGVKAAKDLILHRQFEEWRRAPNTEVHLTADRSGGRWKHKVGLVPHLLAEVAFDPAKTLVMMCGPEVMMRLAIKQLIYKGLPAARIYLSLERNMKCALGFCGHCQFGPQFICKDGPVLRYDRIHGIFNLKEV